MVCKVCGRTIANEEANFCEYCGASFRPGSDNKIDETAASNAQQQYTSAPSFEGSADGTNARQGTFEQGFKTFGSMYGQNQGNTQQSAERPMTFGNWIAIMLLPFIPVVGSIAFIALLFVWSFNKSVPATRKNWARATLVMLGICILFISLLMTYMGTGDMTTLMNSLYAQ